MAPNAPTSAPAATPTSAGSAGPIEPSAPTIDGSARVEGRHRRRRRLLAAFVVVVLVVAGVLVYRARSSSSSSAAAPAATAAPTTAVLVVKDITNDASYDGTVAHAAALPLVARTSGRITGIAAEGTTVGPGQVVFEIDQQPIVTLTGTIPAWRDMGPATTAGPDIVQLQDTLVQLGFDPDHQVTATGTFDAATAAAVVRFQQQLGLEATGTLALGTVIFEPGPIVVGQHQVTVGSPVTPGTVVADAQGTAITMQFTLPADAKSLIAIGQSVDVTMPDRSTAQGTIQSIGTAVDATTGDTITVGRGTIDVNPAGSGAKAPAAITDLAAIKVKVSQTIGRGVLVAPGAALTAHVDGTFTVTVLEPDGTTKDVVVTPGASGAGLVAVTGDGLAAQTKVIIPNSRV